MSDDRMIDIEIAKCTDAELIRDLDKLMAFLHDARKMIPAQFRHTARVEYDIVSDYDESTGEVDRISVHYERPETVSEREERESATQAYQERARVRQHLMQRSASWWADVDRLNFAIYSGLMHKGMPDIPEEDLRRNFHNEASRVQSTGIKPFWWVEEVDG